MIPPEAYAMMGGASPADLAEMMKKATPIPRRVQRWCHECEVATSVLVVDGPGRVIAAGEACWYCGSTELSADRPKGAPHYIGTNNGATLDMVLEQETIDWLLACWSSGPGEATSHRQDGAQEDIAAQASSEADT